MSAPRRSRRFAPAAALLAALLAAAPAMAQDAEAPADGPIVVTGQRTTQEEIANFVDSVIPAPPGSQMGRFHWAICARAGGMIPAQADLVARRIGRVARAAGLEVDDTACSPNLLVIVTPNKGAFLAALRQRRPEYFDGLDRYERARILDPDNPVAAWHVGGPPLNADGHELAPSGGSAALTGGSLPEGVYTNGTTRQASRLGFTAQPQFAAAIVVIEERALTGLTTTQVADYAAMRTLITSRPDRLGDSRAPTILRVIDAPMGSAVPLTLTAWDLGILKGFYASPSNTTAAVQRTETRRRLGQALQGDE